MRAELLTLGGLWIFSIAGAVRAQQAPAGGTEPPKRLFVDSVVASVNDSTILQSKLFSTVAGPVRSAEARQNRSLTLREISQLSRSQLMQLINRYQMAQAAKSFGPLKPEQIDQLLRSELERDKQDRARDLGGYVAFSEELEREGLTWQTYAREQRLEKLNSFAEQFAIYERLRKQSNLYLTPRMLRETYEANRDFFVRPALADVALVTFQGPDAASRAAAASEFWRTGDWTAREVATRFGPATPAQVMRAKTLPKPIRDFGLAGPVGSVSAPLPGAGGRHRVAKVMQFLPARNGRFEDPETQAQVRVIARRRVVDEFRAQALERARQRTEFWIYQGNREPIKPR